jgi:hypothetical protein
MTKEREYRAYAGACVDLATGSARLICRSVLPAGGLAVMAAVDSVRRADRQ